MRLTSPAFGNGQTIPSKHTCDGANVSPPLVFLEVPKNARSLTLICHDPDAPKKGGWTHWVIIDMTPETKGIDENSKPTSGLELTTDFGKPGYGGPCPPSGVHRYFFYLYALNRSLDLNSTATKADVEKALEGCVIEKSELLGLYGKN